MGWDPQQYEKFKAERSRPFFDLLVAVGDISPQTVVDLGCGTGELTAELGKRWPEAEVTGIDSSPEMIEQAAKLSSERLWFEVCSIEQWKTHAQFDLVFSNAALHWLKRHEYEIERLADRVAPGGTFAFQMPNQFNEASHLIIQEVRNRPEWRELVGSESSDGYVAEIDWYKKALGRPPFSCEVWEKVYEQELRGDDAVLEWLKGSALRGLLAKLDIEQQERFLAQCGVKLREAYPQNEDGGTPFPYRRLFVVARRKRSGM